MEIMCPISLKSVNERAVQINAALAILFVILFLFTPYKWLILILFIDFFIRGFLNPSYSLFSFISRTILRIFNVEPLMINAGPKIFAAKIGFVFCCMIAVFYFLNFQAISLTLGYVFIFFAGLEAIFRICIACKIYPFVSKMKIIRD